MSDQVPEANQPLFIDGGNVTLDVLTVHSHNLTFPAGQSDNVILADPVEVKRRIGFLHLSTNGGAPFSITGFVPQYGPNRGVLLFIFNESGFDCTFKNADASSLPENQFDFIGGDVVLGDQKTFLIVYDSHAHRWKLPGL